MSHLDSDSDPYPASFTILSSKSQLLGASNHSEAGLRWCKKELEQVKSISETSSASRPPSLCELCAELANTGPFEHFSHQPGYVTLASSSRSCLVCATLLTSLGSVVEYISSRPENSESQTVIKSQGENDFEENSSIGVGRPTGAGPSSSDSIILSSVLVDPLKLDKDGQQSSLLNLQNIFFSSAGIERYRRFTVVWKGFQFHWMGDVIGISISTATSSFRSSGQPSHYAEFLLGKSLSSEFWQRAIWTSGNVNDIGPRLSMVADWLRDCEENHSLCASTRSVPLPKRLLLFQDQEISLGQVCLALTAGMQGLYAAISYCWGSVVPFTTTKQSFPDRVRGISIQDLPKTFRDFIEVCRQLNICW